jgi:hypothetical protein
MILWECKKNLPEETILQIINIVKNEKFLTPQKLYSTYYSKDDPIQSYSYYDPIIKEMMCDIGLYHISQYEWHSWVQLYNNTTSGHNCHHHFDGSELISWVHFIRAPKQKCFYFMDSYGNKIYPEQQSNGDFICFPSWRLHGADGVNGENFDRIIVAGNVGIYYYESNNVLLKRDKFENSVSWIKHTTNATSNQL